MVGLNKMLQYAPEVLESTVGNLGIIIKWPYGRIKILAGQSQRLGWGEGGGGSGL